MVDITETLTIQALEAEDKRDKAAEQCGHAQEEMYWMRVCDLPEPVRNEVCDLLMERAHLVVGHFRDDLGGDF